MIIGLSGKIASGKTTAASYFAKHGLHVLSTRNLLSSILRARSISSNRRNLQRVGKDLVNLIGAGGFIAIMLEYLPKADYVLDAIRYPGAIDYLRKRFGRDYIQVHLIANDSLRYSRMVSKSDMGAMVTDYRKFEEAATESEDANLKRKADFRVINEGTLKAFRLELDAIYSSAAKRQRLRKRLKTK